jgi:hypothetical protein
MRVAISLARPEPRASRSAAMFTQAIRSTAVTAAPSIRIGSRLRAARTSCIGTVEYQAVTPASG